MTSMPASWSAFTIALNSPICPPGVLAAAYPLCGARNASVL
jgi:hypothetical protein